MSLMLMAPHEVAEHIAKAAQEKRLLLNLSQQSLAARSGVSFSVLKKFERTGKISLESLLKIASVLGCLEDFAPLFKPIALERLPSLDAVMKDNTRKRGRK